jgi:amino acid transporter
MTQSHDQTPEPVPPQAPAEPAVPGFQAPQAGYVYQDQPTHAYAQPPAGQPYPYSYPVAPLQQTPPAYGHYRRPGVITASAVLAYVQAGITGLATFVMFVGLFDSGLGTGLLLVQTVGVLASAAGVGLLIAGGVKIMGGTDRTLLMVACVLQFVICLFYIIFFTTLSDDMLDPDSTAGLDDDADATRGGLILFAILFAVMPIISLSMSRSRSATDFLRSRRG